MNSLTVRLTPWATDRILKNYCKGNTVTKAALRQSLRDMPDTEFWTIATPDYPRSGAVVTTREALAEGADTLEVYDSRDRLLAVIVSRAGSQSVVR